MVPAALLVLEFSGNRNKFSAATSRRLLLLYLLFLVIPHPHAMAPKRFQWSDRKQYFLERIRPTDRGIIGSRQKRLPSRKQYHFNRIGGIIVGNDCERFVQYTAGKHFDGTPLLRDQPPLLQRRYIHRIAS